MRENRVFALCYRCAAFLLCLLGIIDVAGIFRGAPSWTILLYYTTQSNILVLAMLGALIVRTASAVKRGGAAGSSSFFERLSAIVTLSITVTFLVYWVMLSPSMNADLKNLLSFSHPEDLLSFTNLQVHGITPLLMIFDYLFFAERGKMKRQDPWLFAIVPYAYAIQSTVLGFSGAVTYYSGRFPYFFLDFDASGAFVFVYLAVLTVFFLALAYLLLWFDRKRGAA
ncbi:MAG: Pr6Pr family membrane protein [Oscillospiraceae bacterium]|jgi:hypothetical protein|nr:Pr6Pr family membrane protein [Oscillospiraceae bacterium]